MKYHLNPFTGEPSVCTATVKACPWGNAQEDHYPSAESARMAYEVKMKKFMLQMEVGGIEDQPDKSAFKVFMAKEAMRKRARPVRHYLPESAHDDINIDGVTCPHCSAQLLPTAAAAILEDGNYDYCSECEGLLKLDNVKFKVAESKDTYAAFDKNNVTKMTWWHSSSSPTWGESLKNDNGFYAHLGSSQASFDRQIAEKYSGSERESFYLYEIKINDDAVIADEVAEDENKDYSTEHRPNTETAHEAQVQRYINKWEDMASISLVADTNALEVKSSREVTYEEAMKSRSLYNVMSRDFVRNKDREVEL